MKCTENPSNNSRVVTSAQGGVATYCWECAKQKPKDAPTSDVQRNAAKGHVVMAVGKA